jgi:CrcB protein
MAAGRVPHADSHPELPVDADVDSTYHYQGPLHLRWRYVYVVFLGGFLGTVARYGIGLVVPRLAGLPLPTLAVNLVGAFALGLLLEVLASRGPDHGWRRLARLHFGTGFLGAFTTYSALAVDAVLLASGGRIVATVAYLVVSIIGGAALTAVGISVGAKRR